MFNPIKLYLLTNLFNYRVVYTFLEETLPIPKPDFCLVSSTTARQKLTLFQHNYSLRTNAFNLFSQVGR